MPYNLIISDAAEEGIKNGVGYYDSINPELGDRFLGEIEAAYLKLSVHPQYYSFIHTNRRSNIRDVALSSFPYVIIFEVRDETVLIIAIKNTHTEGL